MLGTGITYRIRNIAFDLGYSFYQYADKPARAARSSSSRRSSATYKSRDQVFGFSVSWGG